ncbi:flagellar basal-body rod protein FlgG [Roseateles sp. YR242]|uniref:flagellar hook-basal body protein n=1 Tax=Roseateles sp. YR242 TaxID=1855305 RepID=UPI0008AF7845|nr:flagellar hook-basal body protein [Roseateles sp. YR242]SEK93343.1 flagellar basal-body rod protein FlgG [Roseateles sp. YR242]
MQEILAIALRSMQQDAARLDQIGTNIANVSTPGYKRQTLVARADNALAPSFTQAMSGVAATQAEAVATLPAARPFDLVRDMSAGTLRATGRDLDLSLVGPGWFEVQTTEGPAYTRQGDFQLDARGRLVTARGEVVQGQSGDIQLTSGPFSVDATGRVVQDGRAIDRLRVVSFTNADTLQPRGAGLFIAETQGVILGESDVQVRQGFLENANVQHAREMVDLMQTMRHFESVQRAVQGYDDIVGSAIRKLGDA